MDRLNDPDFQPLLFATAEALTTRDDGTEDERWAMWQKRSFEERQRLLLPLNTLEEMGAMYNAGMFDRALARRLLRATSREYWNVARWLVARYRTERGNPAFYEEWERMNLDLQDPSAQRAWPQVGGLWGAQ